MHKISFDYTAKLTKIGAIKAEFDKKLQTLIIEKITAAILLQSKYTNGKIKL